MRKIRSALLVLINILRNAAEARKLSPFPTLIMDDVTYKAATRADLPKIYECYVAEHGKLPSIWARVTLWLFTQRLAFTVTQPDESGQKTIFLGYIIYYFAERDLKDNTIHDAFHYIAPEARSMGLGKKMLIYANEHFSYTTLSAISAKVSASNIAVNKLIQKLAGTVYIENFYDEDMGEERSYTTFSHIQQEYDDMLAAVDVVQHGP